MIIIIKLLEILYGVKGPATLLKNKISSSAFVTVLKIYITVMTPSSNFFFLFCMIEFL